MLARVARRAYRRPLASDDVETLLAFYEAGRGAGGFDAGIRRGLESILVDPEFLFRFEREPAVAPGRAAGADGAAGVIHPVTDMELASRLSFFLWSSIPDDELLDLAEAGRLRDPGMLEAQVRRMLADARAEALVDGFATQWLALRTLPGVVPTPELFPEFDDNLREAFARETRLFVGSQIREDRTLLDLLRADYTFVNERLARHYGIPNVYGSRFRRVTFDDDSRGGLLGHGSILTVTSYPTRTSPVLRGHWLLEHMLAAPAPAAAPRRAGTPGPWRRRAAGLGARATGAAPRERGVRELPCADGFLSASRSTTSTPSAAGAPLARRVKR